MMYKTDARGNIIPFNQKPKIYRTYKPKTTAQRLRASNKWHIKAEQIKKDSFYLCSVCKDKGIYNYKDKLETHHIIKIDDNKDLAFTDTNLIALCSYHHKMADANKLDKEYLQELTRQRITHLNNS